jgi:hypothetical protein
MRLRHHGEPIALADEEPQVLPLPPLEPVEPVEQPHGRAPRSRMSGNGVRRIFPEIAVQPSVPMVPGEPLRQTG